jgi:hypothetical protein
VEHAERYITPRQREIHASFLRTCSQSETAREMQISQIRVREALVQHERNLIRGRGDRPPSLKRMQQGDVTTRFHVSRDVGNGRPAKHERAVNDDRSPPARDVAAAIHIATRRALLITGADAGSPIHAGFLENLRAYAAHLGAELRIHQIGDSRLRRSELEESVADNPLAIGGHVEVRSDVQLPRFARYPLDGLQRIAPNRSAIVVHGTAQLESLPRLASKPPRIQMTTGLVTLSRRVVGHRVIEEFEHLGAVIVEPGSADTYEVRRISARAERDGSFRDLDRHVTKGRVTERNRVEALVAGDVHHPLTDAKVVAETWGAGGLVDRVRPHHQVLHDIMDFHARNHHDARNHHARFSRFADGRDDVRAELAGVASFLANTRRPGSVTHVVASNHDLALARWLRDSDHRLDPRNAEFFLECERLAYAQLRETGDADILPEVLRSLSPDRLDGVEFLADGASLELAGIEHALHGDRGPDGKRGSISYLESFGFDLTVGHFHRPAIRGGVYVAGLCSPGLGYERGPTTRAVAHVITHDDGTRQHVFQ